MQQICAAASCRNFKLVASARAAVDDRRGSDRRGCALQRVLSSRGGERAQSGRRPFHHAARKSAKDRAARFVARDGELAKLRDRVSDGLSPKRKRYSTEKRPIWVKPHWAAISVTLRPNSARRSVSRALTKRTLRRYRIGDWPRQSLKCLNSVRPGTPDARTMSASVMGASTWAWM